jgi:hypothetical protein
MPSANYQKGSAVTLVKKSRRFRPLTLTGTATNKYQGNITSQNSYERKICEHQMTWSEGHPWPRGSGVYDNGGPFETIRTRYSASFDLTSSFSIRQIGNPASFERDYIGCFMPDPSGSSAFLQTATEGDLRAFVPSLGDVVVGGMGSRAISNSAPTAPINDLGVALAEILREGLPSLLGAQLFKASGKRQIVRESGGEYLNIAFGYVPLLAAIRDTAKAVMDTESRVTQLLKDSGRNVRRKYTFPTERTIVEDKLGTSSYPWPSLTLYHWTNNGVQPTKHTHLEREVWFEGCFTYYLDPQVFQGLRGAAEQARLIHGLTINPSVVWNLLPWSWLVDWFVGVGPVMDNLSSFSRDGLTLRYGYTMEKIRVTQTQTYPGLTTPGGWVPKRPTITLSGERKIRRRQSPFSLGIAGDPGLEARQLAILAALGIKRV